MGSDWKGQAVEGWGLQGREEPKADWELLKAFRATGAGKGQWSGVAWEVKQRSWWAGFPTCLADVDECSEEDLCQSGICTNTDGSFECVCPPGHRAGPDLASCLGERPRCSLMLPSLCLLSPLCPLSLLPSYLRHLPCPPDSPLPCLSSLSFLLCLPDLTPLPLRHRRMSRAGRSPVRVPAL